MKARLRLETHFVGDTPSAVDKILWKQKETEIGKGLMNEVVKTGSYEVKKIGMDSSNGMIQRFQRSSL